MLLAASLTMLAMVSALVTFNGWPQGAGATSVDSVAVADAPAARVVRAVRHPHAATKRSSDAHRRTAAAAARRARARAVAGARFTRQSSGGTALQTIPIPRVPGDPPGEGDGGPTRVVRAPAGRQQGPKGPIGQVACGVGQAVSAVNAAAGAAVGASCKISPSQLLR